MAFRLHIEAEGRKIGFYRLNRLEMEDFEIDPDAEYDREGLLELYERIDEYVESGDLDLLGEASEVVAFDPETASITLDADNEAEVELTTDDITLQNVDVDKKLDLFEKAKVGDLIFVRTEVGEAYWDLSGEGEAAFDASKIALGYLDCTQSHDTYEALRESYYEFLCDLVLPAEARYGDEKLSLDEHLLRTTQVWGELYVVRENLPDHRKELVRLDLGGPLELSVTDPTDPLA
ncbi:hypothetical protein [Hydrogenimonas sp.]